MTNEELDTLVGRAGKLCGYDGGPELVDMIGGLSDALTALRAERDEAVMRADNHEETLRGIQKWLTEGDHARAAQWASDGLAGYNDTAENTLCEAMVRAEAAEARVAELETEREAMLDELDDNATMVTEQHQLILELTIAREIAGATEARALAAEAAALERAAAICDEQATRRYKQAAEHVGNGWNGGEFQAERFLVGARQCRYLAEHVRALITPAAHAALDAALADARKAGKLDGLREAEVELTKEFNITDIKVGYVVVTGASGTPAGCREVVRALAARVEGGDA